MKLKTKYFSLICIFVVCVFALAGAFKIAEASRIDGWWERDGSDPTKINPQDCGDTECIVDIDTAEIDNLTIIEFTASTGTVGDMVVGNVANGDLRVVAPDGASTSTISGDDTATSTIVSQTIFSNDINVGANDLYVDVSSGKVGIGTSDPSELLEVSKNQNTDTAIEISNSTAGTASEASLRLLGEGNNLIISSYSDSHSTRASQNWVQTSAANSDLIMATDVGIIAVKNTTGYVGIATTTPAKLVDIYEATATSTLYIHTDGAGLGGNIILEGDAGTKCYSITVDEGTDAIIASIVTCPES